MNGHIQSNICLHLRFFSCTYPQYTIHLIDQQYKERHFTTISIVGICRLYMVLHSKHMKYHLVIQHSHGSWQFLEGKSSNSMGHDEIHWWSHGRRKHPDKTMDKTMVSSCPWHLEGFAGLRTASHLLVFLCLGFSDGHHVITDHLGVFKMGQLNISTDGSSTVYQ